MMALPGFLVIGMQILCAIHAVRNKRDNWIYIIIFFPGLGCVIYFFAEILPSLGGDPGMRKAGSTLGKIFNPGGDLKRLRREVEISNSIA